MQSQRTTVRNNGYVGNPLDGEAPVRQRPPRKRRAKKLTADQMAFLGAYDVDPNNVPPESEAEECDKAMFGDHLRSRYNKAKQDRGSAEANRNPRLWSMARKNYWESDEDDDDEEEEKKSEERFKKEGLGLGRFIDDSQDPNRGVAVACAQNGWCTTYQKSAKEKPGLKQGTCDMRKAFAVGLRQSSDEDPEESSNESLEESSAASAEESSAESAEESSAESANASSTGSSDEDIAESAKASSDKCSDGSSKPSPAPPKKRPSYPTTAIGEHRWQQCFNILSFHHRSHLTGGGAPFQKPYGEQAGGINAVVPTGGCQLMTSTRAPAVTSACSHWSPAIDAPGERAARGFEKRRPPTDDISQNSDEGPAESANASPAGSAARCAAESSKQTAEQSLPPKKRPSYHTTAIDAPGERAARGFEKRRPPTDDISQNSDEGPAESANASPAGSAARCAAESSKQTAEQSLPPTKKAKTTVSNNAGKLKNCAPTLPIPKIWERRAERRRELEASQAMLARREMGEWQADRRAVLAANKKG